MRRWLLIRSCQAVPPAAPSLRGWSGGCPQPWKRWLGPAGGGRGGERGLPEPGRSLALPGRLGESRSKASSPEPSLTLLPALLPGLPRERGGGGRQRGRQPGFRALQPSAPGACPQALPRRLSPTFPLSRSLPVALAGCGKCRG